MSIQHALNVQYIALLPKYIKGIFICVFLQAITHKHGAFKSQNGSLVSSVWTASKRSKVQSSSWLLWVWGRHWIPYTMKF